MNLLDDKSQIISIDKDDFYSQIASFSDQVKSIIEKAKNFIIPSYFIKVDNIVICGMGASGTIGDLMVDLSFNESHIPITVVKDYNLPKYVDSQTLVIVISHSGDTEEDISCIKQVVDKKAKSIVISVGGELEKECSKHNIPILKIENNYLPRNSFGLMATTCLMILRKLGVIELKDQDILKALKSLDYTLEHNNIETDLENNQAKKIATKMKEKNVLLVAADHLKSTAYRFKLQTNENSKQFACVQNLPELHHNQINGFDFPTTPNIIVIFLYSKFYSPRIIKRIEITKDILASAGIEFVLAETDTVDRLSEIFSFMMLTDLASYYLAILNGVDPSDQAKITMVKERMGKIDK